MFSLLLSFCIFAVPAADISETDAALGDDGDYSVSFEGMNFVAPSSDETIKVTVAGLNEYSYTVKANTGKINGSTSTQSGSTEDGTFSFKYTSTATKGTNTITVTIKSSELEEDITATYKIKVVDVYKISLDVKNSGGMALEDVPVELWIDGSLYRVNEFDIALPTEDNETTTLTFDVNAVALSSGKHTYEIVFDSTAEGLISFEGGEALTASGSFYTGDGGWGLLSIVLSVIVVVMFIFLIITYFRRGKKKRKK